MKVNTFNVHVSCDVMMTSSDTELHQIEVNNV